jgi:hypothetical protein
MLQWMRARVSSCRSDRPAHSLFGMRCHDGNSRTYAEETQRTRTSARRDSEIVSRRGRREPDTHDTNQIDRHQPVRSLG